MINWGSVPAWLAGIGALLALLWVRKAAQAAGRTNAQQAEQLKHQQQQWTDQRAMRDAEQAEKVAAWIEFEDRFPEGVTAMPASEMHGDYHYCLRNASDFPIFEVTVSVLPPGSSDVEESRHRSFRPVVAPGNAPMKVLFAENSKMRSWRIELKFRDARNQ